MDGFFVAKLKKMSNTKPVVSEPSKPAEKAEAAEVIDYSEDDQVDIPNGKAEESKVQKQDTKTKNTKGGTKTDGKLEKLSNSEQALTETVVLPEKKDGAAVADNNGDAKNIPDRKHHKKDYRRKFKKPKNSASKGGVEKYGKATPSSTVRPKQKRKFPSREEISQAREEKRKALKKR